MGGGGGQGSVTTPIPAPPPPTGGAGRREQAGASGRPRLARSPPPCTCVTMGVGRRAHVDNVQVGRVVQRAEQPRRDDRARRPRHADKVDDPRVGRLRALADGDAVERVDVQVGREPALLLPDRALQARLAPLGQAAHVERRVRHVAPVVVEQRPVGVASKRRGVDGGVHATVHRRVRR
eukprot:scaffold8921_cov137-Isochrysis_galbana.AAC.11